MCYLPSCQLASAQPLPVLPDHFNSLLSCSALMRLPRELWCPIPGGAQGQVGWGPGQPGLVLNVEVGGPACGRGLEFDDP